LATGTVSFSCGVGRIERLRGMIRGYHRGNARWLAGAVPTEDDMLKEFAGSVYGAAALGFITSMCAADAIDALAERCPNLVVREVASSCRAIMGGGGSVGLLALLRVSINERMSGERGKAWAADLGNAVYEKALPGLQRLQTAIANHLGRYHDVPDINVFARLIVAQSLAHEAAAYVERRARFLRGCTASTGSGSRQSVPFLLRRMSCAGIERRLTAIVRSLMESRVPEGTDLMADPVIRRGCVAVLNTLGSVDTWAYARDKADELNPIPPADKATPQG